MEYEYRGNLYSLGLTLVDAPSASSALSGEHLSSPGLCYRYCKRYIGTVNVHYLSKQGSRACAVCAVLTLHTLLPPADALQALSRPASVRLSRNNNRKWVSVSVMKFRGDKWVTTLPLPTLQRLPTGTPAVAQPPLSSLVSLSVAIIRFFPD